uniref:Uncharacterized protein n=1 Tax=Kwoniella dejecticola CBS 10117 TaxID=1296121 RepID=A0A1A6AGI8_9TREE|nr:uncharacterized protein I303_01008 [Kwoniella dejecticola CBS 10117]OBR89184.1 hypothetical protein I303_01008 [Kwoniella dejecticola CBS 10117]
MGAWQSLEDWVDRGKEGDWSPSHPSDAQRESMMFLAGSFLFILIFWQGKFPYWFSVENRSWKTIPIPLLAPFKLLTVLYHELGHAVVGMLTIWYKELRYGIPRGGERGRIELIMIDKYEGGLTKFGGDTEPNYALTLPAGYVSKFGAITLFLLTSFAILVCFFVKAKSGLVNNWHYLLSNIYRWTMCNADKADRSMRRHHYRRERRNERARYKHNHEDGPTEIDLHASQDLIIGCSLLVGTLLCLAWIWDDSMWLRFIMLFMGLLSALYAVWDIVLDGIKYAKVAKSDVTYMAEEHNRRVKNHNKLTDMIILVLVLAYFVFRKTKVEQAVESRDFLPAKFHYGPSDLTYDAKYAAGTFADGMSNLVGNGAY